jgi:hypothetical protein
VLSIFSPWKIRRLRPGLKPRTWVLKASTQPLDHRSRYNQCRYIEYSTISWKVIGCVFKFSYISQPLCNSFIYACSVTVFRAQEVLSYFEKWQALCSLTCNNRLYSRASFCLKISLNWLLSWLEWRVGLKDDYTSIGYRLSIITLSEFLKRQWFMLILVFTFCAATRNYGLKSCGGTYKYSDCSLISLDLF